MRSQVPVAEIESELARAYKQSPDPRLRERIQAVRLSLTGQSQTQIAAALCRSPRTVRRYLQAYRQQGLAGLPIHWGPGRPARIPESLAPTLRQWVQQGPIACGRLRANWTYAELAEHLKQEEGIQVSRRAVCDFCHRHGIRPYRPTYRLLRGDPDKQRTAKQRIQELKKKRKRTS